MTSEGGHCASCGATLYGPYCSKCGARDGATSQRTRGIPQHFVLLGVAVAGLVGVIVMTQRGSESAGPLPSAAPTAADLARAKTNPVTQGAETGGPPPDLSTMSPRERFDRLFDRVMRASEAGDTASLTQFAPMAMAAYKMLDTVDADARFHAGLILTATGDLTGAGAMADAIAAEDPRHLFAQLLKGRVAEARGDPAGRKAAHEEFVRLYPSEWASGRVEYSGHQVIIERFLKETTP